MRERSVWWMAMATAVTWACGSSTPISSHDDSGAPPPANDSGTPNDGATSNETSTPADGGLPSSDGSLGPDVVLTGNGYFVAPNGTSSGDGSISSPWDLQTALNGGPSNQIKPGDQIWVTKGTYHGTYQVKLNGTAQSPIIVRNYQRQRATIDGGNSNGNPILLIDGSYTWLWGLEVMSSETNRISSQATSWPTDITYGEGVVIDQGGTGGTGDKFINLVVHDTRQGFSSWKEAVGAEVNGSLAYDNGWIGPDRPHGHNMYIQNQTGTKRFVDNLLIRAYSHNVQSYGSTASNEDNEYFEGNVALDGGERNFMLGGDNVAQNPVWTNNFAYTSTGECNFYLGYAIGYGPGTANAQVTDNYFAAGNLSFNLNAGMTMTGNTFFYTSLSGDVSPGGFPSNTWATSAPSSNAVFVRPNKYEAGRANVVVFNWQGSSQVSIDPSGVLSPGDSYTVQDAQSFYGAPSASGQYNGGTISVSMGGSLPAPVGNDPRTLTHTTQFGVFVLMKTN